MYTKKLTKLLLLAIVSFVIGVSLYYSMDGANADLGSALLFGWLFGSVPYGWKVSRGVIPTIISLNLPIMFLLLIFRFLIAAATGWVAMPIAIIRCARNAKLERSNVRSDCDVE